MTVRRTRSRFDTSFEQCGHLSSSAIVPDDSSYAKSQYSSSPEHSGQENISDQTVKSIGQDEPERGSFDIQP